MPTVWTALVTPLLDQGEVDFESLQKLVLEQERANNGILFLGSTGEALNLASREKTKILDWIRQNKPKVPVMCGVGGSDLEGTIEWLNHINQYPFDAYLMVTPPYAKPGDDGQKQWFSHLMNKSQKPCLLYNVPGRTACSLSRTALESLSHNPMFAGIKESSGDPTEFKKYKETIPNHLAYCGDDLMMPTFGQLGAAGLVSVASNVWPGAAHTYAKQCIDGTFKDTELWKEASQSLFTASNPIPLKYILWKKEWIQSPAVKLPLSTEDFTETERIEKADQKISNWL